MLITLTDANDARLDPYRNIRERDLVKRHKLFVAEGKSVLAVLSAQTRIKIQSVLVLENRLGSVQAILEGLDDSIPVYVVNREIIDTVAGFPMHRGVLAIGERPYSCDQPPALDAAAEWRTVIALSAIANHDNMGSIFRNAAAFGADAVLLDANCCDPLYRKAIRVSVGGALNVPFHVFETSDAMTRWLTGHDFSIAALSPAGQTPLSQWQPPQKTALLMGAEGPGLPAEVLTQHQAISIEMDNNFDSLNVATATGIALHHLHIQNQR